jgi:O-succinylbenzoic acid--CoA ligase
MQVINLLMCSKDLHPVKKLIVGGAEISSELEKLLKPVTTEVYATYGMAETSSHVALRRLNGQHPDKTYSALPEVKLSQDERGCLVIDASYLPETVVSNDLVEFSGSGTFRWLGRYDNLINSGGIKIVPEEVEAIIMSKTMLECIALGYPDKKLGQKLVVVFEKGRADESMPELKKNLENILPRRWKPKELITVPEFPRNDAYKIDRLKLLEMVLE